MIRRHSIFLLLVIFTLSLNAQDIFDAARKGDTARIELLVKLKHDTINARNENGFTPLIIAVYRNQPEAVRLLIKNGADVNANSPEGTAIVAAGYKGNLKLAELLIRNKADLNTCNADGTTALMFAVMGNYEELVNLLLKNGARKEVKAKNGRSALDLARMYGFTGIVKLFGE